MLIILVDFPSGVCVDDVVNKSSVTSIIIVHFMNSARVCWIIRKTIFNVYVCLNHSCRYEHNQFERRDEKPRHQRQFFRQFLYLDVFRKWYRALLVAFVIYCKQNCKFYYFFETKICSVKKIVQYLLRFMHLFCPKINKNDSRKDN